MDMLWRDEDETGTVNCGENVKVKLRGVEEADVAPGFVLCDPNNPCKTGRIFDAQVSSFFFVFYFYPVIQFFYCISFSFSTISSHLVFLVSSVIHLFSCLSSDVF